MAKEPTATVKSANAKVRPDDARGTPPGSAVMVGPHGGRIGNPAFVATEAQRQKVRSLAKTMRGEHPASQGWIARLMGFSVSTLRRHFMDDMEQGRAEVIGAIGAKMIGVAMGTETGVSKEQLDAMKFVLARLGGWSTKIEVGGAGGGPIPTVDLSNLSGEQLEAYGRLAAIAEGQDPDLLIATPIA